MRCTINETHKVLSNISLFASSVLVFFYWFVLLLVLKTLVHFLHHTRTLQAPYKVEMEQDLDSIFCRIRTLKGKLARQHPEAFSHIPEASLLEDKDEDPISPSTTTTIATSEQSTGSCDTSPDTVSPSLSPGFEDLSHVRSSSPVINGRSQTDDEETPGISRRFLRQL
ncbi:kxDL motif-containing protein 1-like [Meles meles]|uniref:kxDL motif-containing protein 1-like n=1 Tax=Meles meles TaxID=9662 RepID=UPI001E69EEBE|nr:kxDL motif-containing protein 1-like [Meles meles]